MARYQHLNPLDHMFYVNDAARKRLGLPAVNVQLILEWQGALDLAGFRRAVAALHRVYPATAARLVTTPVTGQPRWRLDTPPCDVSQVVQVHTLRPATEQELHRQGERLLISPLDVVRRAPVQFHVFRGLPAGDTLIMRWPHALMDVRGAATILEEIARLYDEAPDPQTLVSAGDELRDDVGQLIARLSILERTKLFFRGARAARPLNWQDAHLGEGPVIFDPRGLHYTVRRLTPEQAQRVGDNALRVCGFARFGDFVRACAIHALHRMVPPARARHAGYSTMQLVDNRKRRARAPICHNFFSALPVHVPAQQATNVRAAAAAIAEGTAQMLSSGLIPRRFAVLEQMRRLPPSILIRIMQHKLTRGQRPGLTAGLGRPPSLPMGLTGIPPIRRFCGGKSSSAYGVGAILPHEGLALNLNAASDQFCITGAYFEPRITADTMHTLLDHLVDTLLNPA